MIGEAEEASAEFELPETPHAAGKPPRQTPELHTGSYLTEQEGRVVRPHLIDEESDPADGDEQLLTSR